MKKVLWTGGLILLILAIGFGVIYSNEIFSEGSLSRLSLTRRSTQTVKSTPKKVTVTAKNTTEKLKNAAPATPPASIPPASVPKPAPTQTVSSIAVSLPSMDPTITELSKINKRLDELFALVKSIPTPVNQTTIYQPERECPAPTTPAPEPTPAPVSPTQAIDEASIAYWKFENQRSAAVEDASGHNNSASIFGTPDFVDGKVGKAISLDGVNDYLELNVPSRLSSSLAEFTIGLWVFLNNEQDNEYHCLLSIGPPGENVENFLVKNLDVCIVNKGNIVHSFPRGESEPYYLGTNNIGDISGAWHYVALVYDAENVTIYRDGEAVAVRPATGVVTLGSGYKIRIGSDLSYSRTFARGLFDELRIFDKALTQAEILTIYYAER